MTLLCKSSLGFVQFLEKVVDTAVVVQFFDKVADVPVVQAWRWSRRAENCGVPQLQFSDKLDMPVVVNDRCSELIVDSSATDHGRNRGADRGFQCHRSCKKSWRS